MLKTPSISPELNQLKLEIAEIACFLKEQPLHWWRILLPRVLQIFLQNRLPRAIGAHRTKQTEFFCSPVPVISIVGVLQSDTYNLLCAAEVQDESFVTFFLNQKIN